MAFALLSSTAYAEGHARVLAEGTVLRSGPGAGFRAVYTAHRGEVLSVRERARRGGYWFRLELPDGTDGWVPGDAVYNFELGEEADEGFLPEVFVPPAIGEAIAELSVGFGVLGSSGAMAVRPSLYLAPQFAIEGTALASMSAGGRLFAFTLGGVVNVLTTSVIVPFVTAGGGMAASDPNADTFLLEPGETFVMYGGGGVRIGLRYGLTLRLEARAYAFHEPDRLVAVEELSGGIAVFM